MRDSFATLLASLLVPERHTEIPKQKLRFLVGSGGGHEGDVHAAKLVDLGVVHLGKDDLVPKAQGVVASSVERTRGNPPEVANSGQGDVEQAIHELEHAVAPQGHGGGDGHAFAQLESGDRLPGAAHGGLLAGDPTQLVHRRVQELDVLGRLADAHVDHDLLQARHRHHVGVVPLLHQARRYLLNVGGLEPGADLAPAHLSSTPSQRRQMRTLRPSASVRAPIRVRLPHSPQTTMTLLAWIGASRSAMPPLMLRWGLGRVRRLMNPTPCTITRFFSGITFRIFPCLPASLPAITSTPSFLRSRVRTCSFAALAGIFTKPPGPGTRSS